MLTPGASVSSTLNTPPFHCKHDALHATQGTAAVHRTDTLLVVDGKLQPSSSPGSVRPQGWIPYRLSLVSNYSMIWHVPVHVNLKGTRLCLFLFNLLGTFNKFTISATNIHHPQTLLPQKINLWNTDCIALVANTTPKTVLKDGPVWG